MVIWNLPWSCSSERVPYRWLLQNLCRTLCRKGSLTQLKSLSKIFKIISYWVLNDQIPLSFILHIIFEVEKEKKSRSRKTMGKKWEWKVPRKHKTGRIIRKSSNVKRRMSAMNDGDRPLAHCHLWRLIPSQCTKFPFTKYQLYTLLLF